MRKPELLAPAGDHDALVAALQAGADAVYFGLDEGFNARARATNFSLEGLTQTVRQVHDAGARAYLTFNTLVFESELPVVEKLVRAAAEAGVDALILQDPAVALVARAICPDLELHASTQMTISSPEGAKLAEHLGITRVVVPRELSVTEIERFMAGTPLETEVFIAGALCVSWSGQCLSSEAWGGRSANRGQCAQACRLPYELVVDGLVKPLGDVAYLLSPQDLAGFRAVERLSQLGVHTLKIEGRQKNALYVHSAVTAMRHWVDAVEQGVTPADEQRLAEQLRDLTVAYSRGFGDGFLAGNDHQTLVDGRFPGNLGYLLGEVVMRHGSRVLVRPVAAKARGIGVVSSPLPGLGGSAEAASGPQAADLQPRPGMGVAFSGDEGGPVFEVSADGDGWWLGFGRPGPDLGRVEVGARVWVTSDPELSARAARAVKAGPPSGGIPLRLKVAGAAGEALTVSCREITVTSEARLGRARGKGLDEATLREKLGGFGGTPYRLQSLEAEGLETGLFVPVSELKSMRRELVERLAECRAFREIDAQPVLPRLLRSQSSPASSTRLVPLCRTLHQLEAVIESGLAEVVLDWMELVGLRSAVERARGAGLEVGIATVRIQKPGEEVYDRRIAALSPDSLLVRHWAGVVQPGAKRHGDFSLNVTNSLTAFRLLDYGLESLTAAHDLDAVQLSALLERVPAERMAVVVHHHIPTFHTEHCVYSQQLSEGRDFRSCGRPCEAHRISLRDRIGHDHPVVVDVGCRNTVFNAQAQSAASLVPELRDRGVGRLRLEFVSETQEETARVLRAYSALLEGELTPAEVVHQVGGHEQFGVTQGTMRVLQ